MGLLALELLARVAEELLERRDLLLALLRLAVLDVGLLRVLALLLARELHVAPEHAHGLVDGVLLALELRGHLLLEPQLLGHAPVLADDLERVGVEAVLHLLLRRAPDVGRPLLEVLLHLALLREELALVRRRLGEVPLLGELQRLLLLLDLGVHGALHLAERVDLGELVLEHLDLRRRRRVGRLELRLEVRDLLALAPDERVVLRLALRVLVGHELVQTVDAHVLALELLLEVRDELVRVLLA